MLTATLRAVGYHRVSTVEQSGDRHISLETQDAHIRAHCDTNGFAYVGGFTDVQSGRKDTRPEYRRMLDHVMAGGADAVVVQFLDRFGRNPREILRRYWELQEHGVRVVCTDEDIEEELMLLMRAGLAGAESKRISERVRATLVRVAGKGTHIGRSPYGYEYTKITDSQGTRTVWNQVPAEAAAVREMYRLVAEENRGYRYIADYLQANGHPARSGRWAAYTVQIILGNEAIAGTMLYGRDTWRRKQAGEITRVDGVFPAILTREEWDRLQERLAIRRETVKGQTRTAASEYLLSGIARCGHCGGPLIGHTTTQAGGKRYRNYVCSRTRAGAAHCTVKKMRRAAALEAAVLEYLGQYSNPNTVRDLLAVGEVNEAERLTAELTTVERRLADLESDFLRNLDLLKRGVLDEEDFLRANSVRRQERTNLENRIVELRDQVGRARATDTAAEKLPAAVGSFLADFQGMETRKAKAILQTILKAVHVWRDNRIELEFR